MYLPELYSPFDPLFKVTPLKEVAVLWKNTDLQAKQNIILTGTEIITVIPNLPTGAPITTKRITVGLLQSLIKCCLRIQLKTFFFVIKPCQFISQWFHKEKTCVLLNLVTSCLGIFLRTGVNLSLKPSCFHCARIWNVGRLWLSVLTLGDAMKKTELKNLKKLVQISFVVKIFQILFCFQAVQNTQ